MMMHETLVVQNSLFGEERREIGALKPLLKWAGGKTQLIPYLVQATPVSFSRYAELFLGGGAFFWHLALPGSFIADSNPELINFYEVVRDSPNNLITEVRSLPVSQEDYYALRAADLSHLNTVERAARLIYLNKLCYNGLYRVNRMGQFNTPFSGKTNVQLIDEERILRASELLHDVAIVCDTFDRTLRFLCRGDFVYLDPPYLPVGKYSDFKRYTKDFFTIDAHRRLATGFSELRDLGIFALLSNAYHEEILALYKGHYHLVVDASRQINCKSYGRGKIRELLIANYEFDSSSIIS